jgi:hypothetical protein
VFLLGLTLPKSQILFWDTERIRLFYFSTTIGTPPESLRMAFFSRESILWWVVSTFHRRRKQYQRLFDSKTFPHLAYVEFRKPSEAQIFLARLGTTAQITGTVEQVKNHAE